MLLITALMTSEILARNVKPTAQQPSTKTTMKNSFASPDFAFPQDVITNADSRLMTALKTADWLTVCQAVTQLYVAENRISRDSVGSSIARIDTIAQDAPEFWKAVLLTLEAKCYSQVYERNRWEFNNRELPLDSYPENIMEWSKQLFAKKLLELTALVRENSHVLFARPSSEIQLLLQPQLTKEAARWQIPYLPYYPTVGDALYHILVGCLSDFNDGADIIPFGNSGAKDMGVEVLVSIKDLCDERIENACQSKNYEALIQAALDKVQFLDQAEAETFMADIAGKVSGTAPSVRYYLWKLRDVNLSNLQSDSELYTKTVELFRDANAAAAAFPKYTFTPQLNDLIEEKTMPKLTVKVNETCFPGEGIVATTNLFNARSAELLLYRLPNSYSYNDDVRKVGTLIRSFKLNGSDEFLSQSSDSLRFALDAPGLYCLYSTVASKYNNCVKFEVSELQIVASISSMLNDDTRFYVVSGKNQQPVEGAKIKATSNYRSGSKDVINVYSDADGSFRLPDGDWNVTVEKNGSLVSEYIWVRDGRAARQSNVDLAIYTDRALYRPGSEVSFVCVGSLTDHNISHILRGDSLSVELRDANRKIVDVKKLSLDETGRATGSFTIPTDRLNGSWVINAFLSHKSSPDSEAITGRGAVSIHVEDYKAPSFFVELDSIASTSLIGKPLNISGYVKSYSGMPVANAEVKINISTVSFWWRYDSSTAKFNCVAKTDEKGRFELSLDTERLKGTRFEYCLMRISGEATDEAGETQQSNSLLFSFKGMVSISANLPQIISTDNTEKFKVAVKSVTDELLNLKVRYNVSNTYDGDVVSEGEFVSPVCPLDASQFAPGCYTVSFQVADEEFKDSCQPVVENFVIYSKSSDTVPFTTPLWLEPAVIDNEQGSATLRYGSSYPDSWFLVQISDCNGLIERKWVNAGLATLNSLTVNLPAKGNKIFVQISGMHNFESEDKTVSFDAPADLVKGKIEIKSFRDKLVPGDDEVWSFRFLVDDKPVMANMLATMTDKALNAIVPFRWSTPSRSQYFPDPLRLICKSVYGNSATFTLGTLTSHYVKPLLSPDWYFYNADNYGIRYKRARGVVMDYAMASNDAMVEMAAPMMMKSMAVTEEFESEDAIEETDVTGSGSGAQTPDEGIVYRLAEMPQAFFKPLLCTDSEGIQEIAFQVPDFNTTWAFQLVGYDSEMHSASIALDAVAAKKVMVKPNMPRFLRAGDKAQLRATLFNNSDEVAEISAKFEIINALTGEVVARKNVMREVVSAMGSRVAEIEFTAPSDCEYLIIRSIAELDEEHRYIDAEQGLLVVLPASEPVVESQPFWMAPEQSSIEMNLPKYQKDDCIWLTYCDNPVWLCLTALPDITTEPSKDIFSQVAALYGRSIAAGLTASIPEAKQAIAKWIETNDPALTSPLEKNGELKTLALQRTPWVQNAESETVRMHQLSALLDSIDNQLVISKLVDNILKLQSANGGFRWLPGDRVDESVYATSSVLLYCGMLKQFGYLPENQRLISALEKAVKYCDAEAMMAYRKYESLPSFNWLYTRSFFDVKPSTEVKKLYNRVLDDVEKNWRSLGIYSSATAAIVLNRANRNSTAELILESLRQKASSTLDKGIWFDNLSSEFGSFNKLITTTQALEAYTEITSDKKMIDGLRQWLILQRQTEDWGTSRMLAEVVNAVLKSGSGWLTPVEQSVIKLNGKSLDIKGEAFTGSVTIPLKAKDASGSKLSIGKNGDHPAWGAVVSRRYLRPDEVSAVSTPDVKIEKRLLIISPDDGSLKEVTDNQIKVGDKVRVLLTVTMMRDADYVAITDSRSACLEPMEQVSGYTVSDGLWLYRETSTSSTQFFMTFMPKGVSQISYDCFVDRAGEYSLGIATLQSQYAPSVTAHSGGAQLRVNK